MTYISIETTQNVDIRYELASIGDRIAAQMIDWAVLTGYIFLVLILHGLLVDKVFDGDLPLFVNILLMLPWLFYELVSEIFFNGQTFGKHQKGIRVIAESGMQPGISSFLLRWLLRPIDLWLSGSVAILSIIITGKGQRLGDIAAGTCVVKILKKEFDIASRLPKVEDDYTPIFLEVAQLTDKDIWIIEDVVMTYGKNQDLTAISILAKKIKDLLQIQTELADLSFLYRIIKDYRYLTATPERYEESITVKKQRLK
jgi:uncharacterized RDD family membrane protein YckC